MSVVEWDNVALVPVTIRETTRAVGKLHDRFELPEPMMLVGLSVHKVLFDDRLTTPLNPFKLVIVAVELPVLPATTVMPVGFVEMLKLVTATETMAD